MGEVNRKDFSWFSLERNWNFLDPPKLTEHKVGSFQVQVHHQNAKKLRHFRLCNDLLEPN